MHEFPAPRSREEDLALGQWKQLFYQLDLGEMAQAVARIALQYVYRLAKNYCERLESNRRTRILKIVTIDAYQRV
jgi:hypothetical protein